MRPTVPPPSAADIDRRFREAVALHQSGDVVAASVRYAELRHHVPAHPELLHLYGTALIQLGRPGDAVPVLTHSLKLRPNYAPTLEMAGTALLKAGDARKATTVLAKAATLQPQSLNILMRLGDARLACGQHGAARDTFQKALAVSPGQPEAVVGLATALSPLGQQDAAVALLQASLAAHPNFAGTHITLGTLLGQQERFTEAEEIIRAGLKIRPDLPIAHHLLAKTLRRQGRVREAEAAYRVMFDLGLRTPTLLTEYGELLLDDDRSVEAESPLREALGAAPQTVDALIGLGRVEEARGALDQALLLYNQAIGLDANDANAYVNRGSAKRFLGDIHGALVDFDRALALKPGFPAAVASRGITLLSQGRLREGWPDFRARVRARYDAPDLAADRPWDGTPLDGKRILVWTEYGLGDEIMSASLLPDLLTRVAQCTLACSPRLVSVFQRAFPSAVVVPTTSTIAGAFDARLPLMDAASWLRPSLDSFPRQISYLTADAAQSAALRARYGANRKRLVGISWRSTSRTTGFFKSMRLADWTAILKIPDTRFVSLQYGDHGDEIAEARAASGADIVVDAAIDPTGDVEMFAAQINAMDLIISASNTTVHLAGALGKSTWLLAPRGQGAHWYWFNDHRDSPWYPALRIFQQPRPGTWDDVIMSIAAQLRSGHGL